MASAAIRLLKTGLGHSSQPFQCRREQQADIRVAVPRIAAVRLEAALRAQLANQGAVRPSP